MHEAFFTPRVFFLNYAKGVWMLAVDLYSYEWVDCKSLVLPRSWGVPHKSWQVATTFHFNLG